MDVLHSCHLAACQLRPAQLQGLIVSRPLFLFQNYLLKPIIVQLPIYRRPFHCIITLCYIKGS